MFDERYRESTNALSFMSHTQCLGGSFIQTGVVQWQATGCHWADQSQQASGGCVQQSSVFWLVSCSSAPWLTHFLGSRRAKWMFIVSVSTSEPSGNEELEESHSFMIVTTNTECHSSFYWFDSLFVLTIYSLELHLLAHSFFSLIGIYCVPTVCQAIEERTVSSQI